MLSFLQIFLILPNIACRTFTCQWVAAADDAGGRASRRHGDADGAR